MSSIVTAVFKATFGLLVNKGRDKAAEKLKEGDVTDQKIRDFIIREIDDVKSKLDALAREKLDTAIDAFEAGLKYMYQAIDEQAEAAATGAIKRNKNLKELSLPLTRATVTTVAHAEEMTNMELTKFSQTTKSALSQAEKRFKMAREEATKAFNNEALSTHDRITAVRYRVMATMLESAVEAVGTAGDLSSLSVESALKIALPECTQCLQKLHSLPDVQNNLKVEFEKGLLNVKGRFGKDERREIISAVCQVNRAVYDAMKTAGKGVEVWTLPSVGIGEAKIDPLRDPRVAKVLRKVGMEHCCVAPWSFGQEDEKEHRLKIPCGIATNAEGEFIIADNGVKVFDSSGKFLVSFKPQIDDADTEFEIRNVATDVNRDTYVLVELNKPGAEENERQVQVFEKTGDLLRRFPMRRGYWCRLTISNNKVLILGWSDERKCVVDVYERDGEYVHSFGEGILKDAGDITVINDGRVMIVDRVDSCVHVLTEDGTQLSKVNITTEGDYYRMACHPAGEYFVVAGKERGTNDPRADIYTKDGKFVRSICIALDEEKIVWLGGITVTMEGHIVVAVRDERGNGKIIVL